MGSRGSILPRLFYNVMNLKVSQISAAPLLKSPLVECVSVKIPPRLVAFTGRGDNIIMKFKFKTVQLLLHESLIMC